MNRVHLLRFWDARLRRLFSFVLACLFLLAIAWNSVLGQGSWEVLLSDESTRYGTPTFINADTGWVPFGTAQAKYGLLKTTNGGNTWDTIAAPHGIAISPLWFIDALNAWSFGGGDVSRTIDGGYSWTDYANRVSRITPDISNFSPNAIWSPHPDTVWLAGSNTALRRSLDRGESWETMLVNPSTQGWRYLSDICFVGSQYGWAVGGNRKQIIVRTTDGGTTWIGNHLDGSWEIDYGTLIAVSFFDSLHGFALSADNAASLKTTDGGITWEEHDTLRGLNPNTLMTDVVFLDSLNGWVTEYGKLDSISVSYIHGTIDGGTTWSTQVFEHIGGLDRLVFPTPNVGYAAGSRVVFKYCADASSVSEEGRQGAAELDLRP